jgi:adhesin/invasin
VKTPAQFKPLIAFLAMGFVACGGEDLVLPSEGEPASIALLQGDGQTGRVGEMLPQPIILQVADGTGRPVAGATVVIEVSGAVPDPDTVVTEEDGRATVAVQLGPTVGSSDGVARVVVPDNQAPVEVGFTVNAVAASANGLVLESGNEQTAPAGTALPQPLVVRTVDAFGNPIAGVTITWGAVGGGSVSEGTTVSDESGLASVTRTLGSTAGPQSTLASSEGLSGSPVTFLHTATPGSATGVVIVSGNEQSGVPGTALAQPLVVQVNDAAGNPVTGAPVTWVVTGGGGTLDPSTATTDATGRASSIWTLGAAPGANTAEAVVSGVGQATFTATGLVGTPNEIRIASGNGQTGQTGQRLGSDLVVLVLDERDNPIPGATVAWQVQSGGGSVDPASSATDASGRASARWTLGSAPGANTLRASVSGAGAVTFQATAAAGSPSTLALATQPSNSAQVGVPFGRQPLIQLRDAAGNDVGRSGVAVTAAIASGPGSLGGTATRTTDANGRASFNDLRINGAVGPHTIIFAATGFTSVTSDGINVGRTSTTTQITGDAPDASVPGAPVTVSFTVTSPGGTVTGPVTVTASGGPETCSADVAVGSCAIVLSGTGSRTLTASYAGNSLFAPSSDDESHNVQAQNEPPTAADDQFDAPATGDRTLEVAAPGVLGNDSDAEQDALEAELVANVSNGTLTLDADGGFRYTPAAEFQGEDSFTYRASDGSDTSSPATVRITVPVPPPAAPPGVTGAP